MMPDNLIERYLTDMGKVLGSVLWPAHPADRKLKMI